MEDWKTESERKRHTNGYTTTVATMAFDDEVVGNGDSSSSIISLKSQLFITRFSLYIYIYIQDRSSTLA